MRLIDADELKKKAVRMYGFGNNKYVSNTIINQQPTIDAVPVAHGRWEEADDRDGVVCSICREDFCTIYLETERFNYCPNCGARMDGDSDEG